MLTDAQSAQINDAVYTHDYEALALAEYEQGLGDGIDKYTALFEAETGVLDCAQAEDLGGIIVYMAGNTLVAFYDYERFVGSVFTN